MTLEEKRSDEGRDGAGKEILYGVEVLCGKAKWLVVSMVDLVEAFVEERKVEDPMAPVKYSVLHQEEEGELRNHLQPKEHACRGLVKEVGSCFYREDSSRLNHLGESRGMSPLENFEGIVAYIVPTQF